MARMHTRKKGKSKSRIPEKAEKPAKYDESEVERFIVESAKQGKSKKEIGAAIREKFGIPRLKAGSGKKISAVLKDAKIAEKFPEDLMDLVRKAVRMRAHLKENSRDGHNKTKVGHVEAKIRRLAKYYSAKKRIPAGWKYNAEEAALLVK